MTKQQLTADNAALRFEVRQLQNSLAEAASVLLWVEDLLEERPVSEFAESFELVARVMDLIDHNCAMNCLLAKVYPDRFVCEACFLKNANLPSN